MFKRIAAVFLVVLTLALTSCSTSVVGALKSYANTTKGYEFLYPNGWEQVKVNGGPDVVFHDLIEQSENVSVVISEVPNNKSLEELGTPTEVGYKLSKSAIAPPDSGRTAELIDAQMKEKGSKTYYLLEYRVKFPDRERHNLASVAISRGKLFTLNVSTTQSRWKKVKDLFEAVVNSFSVY
ncbi:photosystem II reaction center PsbP family protein [Oxynema sp. CENA135]|uniref:photosystem II reaction center PsbP n=1 Tax=Oxynema sp. CENA135 TaxID=984206 RepID=UPI001909972F|nr:photosystem II reaction center PsbP [Oxynema sp. CENA135]MBK4732230.1 photosystem II reaction center PsbP family protein [Oxynema sp. CENA135]